MKLLLYKPAEKMPPIALFLCFAVLTVHTTTSSPTVCPQKTTSGKCCSIPFKYRGVTFNSCTSADYHRPWCSLDPVYEGRWGNCTLPVTRTSPTVCPQQTRSGKCCSIPFKYRGVTFNSCTSADYHRLWCSLDPVYKGRWGNCTLPVTRTSPTVCPQQTTSGKCCNIPFKYRGVTFNSCTSADYQRPWCSLDPVYKGRWGNCTLPVTRTSPTVCPQQTRSGKCCSVPFKYRGVTFNSCTSADYHRPWCSLDPVYEGRWGNCTLPVARTSPTVCPQPTTSGKCCNIPFKYRGVTFNSCTSADYHRPWCSLDPVYKGRWDNCTLPVTKTSPTVCPQQTTSGKCCSVPFNYKAVSYNSCTNADHNRPWCSLDSVYKGRWGYCLLPTTPSVCFPKTTSGQCCSVPFKYKQVTFNSCTTADYNRPWCSLDPVYKGRWGICRG